MEEEAMEIMTPEEAAERFKLALGSIHYLVQTDQIPYYRIGKRVVRFSKAELQEWFQSRKFQKANYKPRAKPQPRDGNGRFK